MDGREESRITGRSFLVGLLCSALFAGLTVFFADRRDMYLTATQIPVLPYVLLLLTVLVINPLCRLLRVARRFTRCEIMIVFAMGLVSSGVSTYGLTAQLAPVIGSLFNRSWNNEQSQWSRHVVPFVNEAYFLSEKGIQEAAREYMRLAARRQDVADLLVAASRRAAAGEGAPQGNPAAADEAAPGAAGRRGAAGAPSPPVRDRAETQWQALRAAHPEMPAEAAAALPLLNRLLAECTRETETAREKLRELENAAFAKVDLFRRGLPRGLRAYPGIVMLPEDTTAGYLARFRRMVEGRRAAAELKEAEKHLAARDAAGAAAMLDSVAGRIAGMCDTTLLQADIDAALAAERELAADIAAGEAALRELRRARRQALRRDIYRLDSHIARCERRLAAQRRRLGRMAETRQNLQQQVETLREGEELKAAAGKLAGRLRAAAAAAKTPDSEPVKEMRLLRAGLPRLDGTLRRYLVGDVPWRDWLPALGRWLALVGLTYLALMALNVLIFRQWAHNEKLIYPLAELPLTLAGVGEETDGVPAAFRSGLFWSGFAVSALVLGYNVLVATSLVPGLEPLDLNNSWAEYIANTPLQGLLSYATWSPYGRSHIFFTMIGLSFLIPKKVSFSLWFFTVLSMLQLLLLVGLGHGQNESSFPAEWWYTLSFRTAEGGGALIVFAAVVLFKCRRYLLCAFRPASVAAFPDDERRELRLASACFLLASLGVVTMLWLGMGANLAHTIFVYAVVLVITIGLVRAVTEGGVLGFQCWAGPFHFLRAFCGMDKSWTAPSLFAPLMVYYSVLFLDIKTFIAPAMANSLKIRDTLRMRRGRFHLAVFAGIAAAVVVSIATSLMLAYSRGADLMSNWFYSAFPRSLFDQLANISRTPPAPARAEALWAAAGGGAMALLLYFRQKLFWLPHPIGMIMLVSPIMGAYWFSILLGWLCKSLVTRYGNKETYLKTRLLFIGLIAGELVMVVIGMALSYALDVSIPVGLNRN